MTELQKLGRSVFKEMVDLTNDMCMEIRFASEEDFLLFCSAADFLARRIHKRLKRVRDFSPDPLLHQFVVR